MTELPGWDDVDTMTVDQARLIRELRVSRGFTWRAVADECAGPEDDWAEGLVVGQLMCERAAALLGEDPGRALWR
jgi:hypothetical protein